jgi:hypothetical protein
MPETSLTIEATADTVTTPVPSFSPTGPTSEPVGHPTFSPTRAINELVYQAGTLRGDVRDLAQDVDGVHQSAFRAKIDHRALEFSSRPVAELLADLGDMGFAWRDIARILRVSVPGLRRWRLGEAPRGENRLAVARLVALVDILATMPIDDVASWLEMPLVDGISVSPLDVMADGASVELCELYQGHISPEDLLDRYRPGWQTRYDSDYEVFEAEDGELALKPKQAGTGAARNV